MKKFTKFSRGFTLIELLVVIAIIGILSSIVLASLSTARNKANDSKVEEQLSGLRSAAEIYSNGNGYGTAALTSATGGTLGTACGSAFTGTAVFGDPTSGALAIMNGIASTSGVSSIQCIASSSAWAVQVTLPSGGSSGNNYWCVDSTGKSEARAYATFSTANVLCP